MKNPNKDAYARAQAQFRCTKCSRGYVAFLGPGPLGSPKDVAELCPDTCGGCGAPMDKAVGKGAVHFGLAFS